jgi:hypothetical protein
MAIDFRFKVGKAFQNSNRRPITVPRTQVNYALLEKEMQDMDDKLAIICPDGARISGYMYSGTSSRGQYYQIEMHGYENDPLSRLKMGAWLNVEVMRIDSQVQINLTLEK